MNSITKRWVRGSLLITIVVLLLAEAVFLYFTINNRYDAVRRAMQTRAQTLITQLSASDAQSAASRGIVLRRMVEQFADKDKFELTLLDASGRVAVSSTGYVVHTQQALPDYLAARGMGG
ncbi:MAG: sensor histidine kinase, partial [Ruthenibacterium sp.]